VIAVGCEQGFWKEVFTRRNGLVRVLYFLLAGRGRVPSKAWPIVKCFCEPTISVFDPPTYVVASLREHVEERVRVRRGGLAYGDWREVRTLPPDRVLSKSFIRTAMTLDRRPRRLFH
jgi:hypothetical protein